MLRHRPIGDGLPDATPKDPRMAGSAELALSIATLERGYDSLLAYAELERKDDTGSDVRHTLVSMHTALDGLGALVASVVGADSTEAARVAVDLISAVTEDARKARGAIALVLSRPAIGSRLVRSLNASSHLRALLSDVMLVDQVLRKR
jgi:hypothetical protein